MKIDKVIRVLFLIVIILVIVTSGYTCYIYNNLCNNNNQYTAVEFIQSADAYHLCPDNFGIINTGDKPIIVTKRKMNGSEVTAETLEQNTTAIQSTKLMSGDTLAIEASNDIVYQVSNPLGSDLDHSIKVKKF